MTFGIWAQKRMKCSIIWSGPDEVRVIIGPLPIYYQGYHLDGTVMYVAWVIPWKKYIWGLWYVFPNKSLHLLEIWSLWHLQSTVVVNQQSNRVAIIHKPNLLPLSLIRMLVYWFWILCEVPVHGLFEKYLLCSKSLFWGEYGKWNYRKANQCTKFSKYVTYLCLSQKQDWE